MHTMSRVAQACGVCEGLDKEGDGARRGGGEEEQWNDDGDTQKGGARFDLCLDAAQQLLEQRTDTILGRGCL